MFCAISLLLSTFFGIRLENSNQIYDYMVADMAHKDFDVYIIQTDKDRGRERWEKRIDSEKECVREKYSNK